MRYIKILPTAEGFFIVINACISEHYTCVVVWRSNSTFNADYSLFKLYPNV